MEKSNQKRLEEYLVGNEKSYLKSDISNGKVIMLSGKWGSGKTFFWKEIIEKNLKKEKIPNNYISLYGKTSIQEIKNEVFLKIFETMDIFKIDDKSFGLAKDTANLITDITKSVSVFGFNLDLSKIVDKSFEKLEKVKDTKKEKDIKDILNSGAIICFDDFERKSKDIDLNDLFGFITNLTIEFDCKVVIILNDDVFEGEEKKIFSNVKEKSVSKFLKYEPSIKELFEIIFENDERYRKLDDHKEIILKTIEETEELNARIYIQVLDNLVEWIEKKQEISDLIIRYLILINISFIINHISYILENYNYYFLFVTKSNVKIFDEIKDFIQNDFNFSKMKQNISNLKNFIEIEHKRKEIDKSLILTEFIDKNTDLINAQIFINKHLKEFEENKNAIGIFTKINNFIETGILINE